MMDYKNMYDVLFSQISKAIEEIEKSPVLTQEIARGITILKEAQQTTESIYIESGSEVE